MKRILIVLLAAIMVLGGCSAANSKDTELALSYEPEIAYEDAEYAGEEAMLPQDYIPLTAEAESDVPDVDGVVLGPYRKEIKTAVLDAETLEYDTVIGVLEDQIKKTGGYIEHVESNGRGLESTVLRSADYTIRIPKEEYDAFIAFLEEKLHVLYKSEQVDDITNQYTDIEAHIEALETEQERLLELIEQADNIDVLLVIESKLTDIRYELGSYQSQLFNYDNQVEFCTVELTLDEVRTKTEAEEEDISVWKQMWEGITDSVHSIGEALREGSVGIVSALPYLMIAVIVVLIVILLYKRRKKQK